MNPFQQYHNRFLNIRKKLTEKAKDNDLSSLAGSNSAELNNLFMAGLGMSTLFLRMGAVIQMSEKLHDGNAENDALFMKQVIDNLRETLPSDTNWKNLWCASMQSGSVWENTIPVDNNKNTMLDRFVTFRNKFVHQYVRVIPEHAAELRKGLAVLDEMCGLAHLFEDGSIQLTDGKYFWEKEGSKLELHPFVQEGDQEGLPYLFQGLYEGKSKAKFINTFHGDETKAAANTPLEEQFQPMQQALRGGAGQYFDHGPRMQYYLDCFVGRERETDAIMAWILSDSPNRVLPIFSEAGMGKGALIAGVIQRLIEEKNPVLYHFCGSGMANNLHAVLYHLIMQGNKQHDRRPVIWKTSKESILRKLSRLPSRYHDTLHLFQQLLTDCYAPSDLGINYKDKPLVIIIDGLDEAAVANSQLKIADWFYTYNDKDEPESDWVSPGNIRWIFTYRSLGEGQKKGFSLGGRFSLETIPLVQPLQGLGEEAVREALKEFEVPEEFVQAVMERGAVL
jgi:hypothetical protein